MSNFDDCPDFLCHPGTEIKDIATFGSLSLCTLLASLYVMYKLYRIRDLVVDQTMLWLTFIFLSICSVHSILAVPFCEDNHHSEHNEWLYTMLFISARGSYIFHWVAMVSIYFVRLKLSFESTTDELQLSKYHKGIFIAGMLVVISLFGFAISKLIVHSLPINHNLVVPALGVFVMVTATYSQILVILFVRRLHHVNILCRSDPQLIAIMVRQSILIVFSMMSSTLVIGATIAWRFLGDKIHVKGLTFAVNAAVYIDVLVDVISISLGLSVFDPVYYFLCGAVDRCIKSCCSRVTLSRRSTIEVQLTELVASNLLSLRQNKEDSNAKVAYDVNGGHKSAEPDKNPDIDPNVNLNIDPNVNVDGNPNANPNINSNDNANVNPDANSDINPDINPDTNPDPDHQKEESFGMNLALEYDIAHQMGIKLEDLIIIRRGDLTAIIF